MDDTKYFVHPSSYIESGGRAYVHDGGRLKKQNELCNSGT